MNLSQNAEQLGASAEPIPVAGTGALASVHLTPAGQRYLAAPDRHAPPSRVYLALENVRGTRDATVLNAYLLLPGPGQANTRQLLAGGEALYGLRRASNPQGSNRAGLTLVFDLTPLLAELRAVQPLPGNELRVRIAPQRPLPDTPDITVARISVFRTPQDQEAPIRVAE